MSLGQDVTYAVRSLRRSPVYAITALASLAVGIAGNATIFSLVDALLLRAKPGISMPDRLVDVGRTVNGEGFDTFSYPNYVDYRQRSTVFDGLAAYREGEAFGLSVGGEAVRVFGGQVSANYFEVLGTSMHLGRAFRPDEERTGDPRTVAVISHDLWRTRFGADGAVIGSEVRLNGRPYTIVGVTPEGFSGYSFASEALWVPLTAYPEGGDLSRLENRGSTWLKGVGRLRDGVTAAQAQASLQLIVRDLAREFPAQTPEGWNIGVVSAGTIPQEVRGAVTAFMAVLFALVAVILLIACTNVSGMLLARGLTRRREVALRLALGAARHRIVALLVTETLLVAAAGAVLAVAIAALVIRLLYQLVPVLPIDVTVDFRIDWRVVVFSAVVAFGAAIVSGLVPALRASAVDLAATIKPESAAGKRGRLGTRQVFVIAQVSLSMLLVVCAVLLGRSLQHASAIDPGFEADGVEVAGIDLRLGGYDAATGPEFAADLVSRMEQLPGVESAASARVVPLTMTGYSQGWLWLPEHVGDNARAIPADWNLVTAGYFDTVGTPVVRGRAFASADDATAPRVVIVNQTLANRAWPGQDPVGRTLVFGRQQSQSLEVVGVAADTKYQTIGEPPQPFVYVPVAQHYHPEMWLLLRTSGPTALPALRRLLDELDPTLPIVRASTLAEATAFGLVPSRLAAWLAGIVGGIGVLLAVVGLYGVVAYNVSRRTREIGIRVAIGARRLQVVGMVVRQGMTIGGTGVVIGILLASAGSRTLGSFLYGVEPLDPASFMAAAALMTALAVAASVIPARKAASVNPAETLRAD